MFLKSVTSLILSINLRFKLSHTDYQHFEMEGSAIGLDYFDRGTDAKFEIVHSLLSEAGGVLGLDVGSSRFSQNTKPYAAKQQAPKLWILCFRKVLK